MDLYCYNKDLTMIKENKIAFINNLIGLNIPYNVVGLVSTHMNIAIKEIEDYNNAS